MMKFVITKWSRSITDSGKDEYTGKRLKSDKTYKFRLLDDDGVVYCYGESDENLAPEPLDVYMYDYGVTEIQYKTTKGWETV